jgi:hypothetical protein
MYLAKVGRAVVATLQPAARQPGARLGVARQVAFDIMLTEELVTCRVVLDLRLGRTSVLQTRVDEQQEQT